MNCGLDQEDKSHQQENNVHKLIYGKSGLNRIVGFEVNGTEADIYIQDESLEKVIKYTRPNKYWLLASQPLDKKFARLHGDLHYKWGRQFNDKNELFKFRNIYKNEDTYSLYNSEEALMVKDGYSFFQGMKHGEISVLSFDIETTTMYPTNDESLVILISSTYRDSKGLITRKLFSFDEYTTQYDMINAFSQYVVACDPSIICGHNIFGFDLPYLRDIVEREGGSLNWGREGNAVTFNQNESKFRKDGSQFYHYHKAHCYGRTFCDTMFLSIKYDVARQYESYGLKAIIKHEGLEVKDRQFYDASKIRFNYTDAYELSLIKTYAIHDADDALALYDLMIPSYFYMAQSIPKTFEEILLGATGSQINSMMCRAYLQDGHSLPKADEAVEYEGAISEGNPGIYRNVHKVDVASLYPSIMIEYEVYDVDKDPKAHFLNLVKTFTKLRLDYKKLAKESKYYDDLQGAFKILINSCYGFLGTAGLNFNCPEAAAFITNTGRNILTQSINWAKDKGFTIVNCDTDSISYTAHENFAWSEDVKQNLIKDLNSNYPTTIRFEDDGFYDTFIVFKAKNYVMYDKAKNKLKTKGSALKDAKKEIALKTMQSEMIWSIIKNEPQDNLVNIYHRYVKIIRDGIKKENIKDWCSKKTLTEKIWSSERTNESKVKDAIQGTEYKESDKIWTYFKTDGSLGLMENYNYDYDHSKMYEKVFKSINIFENVLPEDLFINYKLKKNVDKISQL
jgi:DNA polymerase I